MFVLLTETYQELSRAAAKIIANAVREKPNVTLGLAAGSTPLGTYQELVRMHREEGLDFSRVATFNLDEYVGLPPGHPQSYHSYMARHFFDHVNIDPRNIHIPDGSVREDYAAYCAWYEQSIHSAGGIDLQVLGIGADGHIGFNEPTSSLSSRTRLKTLTAQTLEENRRFFGSEEVPPCAITMGLGTILEARTILLLASGSRKAEAVAAAVEGPVSAFVPASVLQFHQHVTVILDAEASAELRQKDYYRRVMEMTAAMTPRRFWSGDSPA